MKKKIVMTLLSIFFAAVTVLPISISAGEQVLKLDSWGPEEHSVAVPRAKWIEEVNAAYAGQFKIVQYSGGQLYDPKEMHMAVDKGSVYVDLILAL